MNDCVAGSDEEDLGALDTPGKTEDQFPQRDVITCNRRLTFSAKPDLASILSCLQAEGRETIDVAAPWKLGMRFQLYFRLVRAVSSHGKCFMRHCLENRAKGLGHFVRIERTSRDNSVAFASCPSKFHRSGKIFGYNLLENVRELEWVQE